jgi:DNA-binding NarL/FixJ family response regulator
MGSGAKIQEIAEAVGLSRKTVSKHLANTRATED